MLWTRLETPNGPLTLTAGERGLRTIHFAVEAVVLDPAQRDDTALAQPRRQLSEYFAGARRAFDLALDPGGTAFQQRVWRAVQAVAYGETTTYLAVAGALGDPHLSRAVGACNARTPIPIVMPCHRVVGSDGRLTGYRGGLEVKRALLAFEGSQAARTAGAGASSASSARSTSISTIPPTPRVRTVGS
jgi:methylated-DNA-[protein]-cysteine S-methyltransferase